MYEWTELCIMTVMSTSLKKIKQEQHKETDELCCKIVYMSLVQNFRKFYSSC